MAGHPVKKMIFGLGDYAKSLGIAFYRDEIAFVVGSKVLKNQRPFRIKPINHSFFAPMTKWRVSKIMS